MCLGQPLGWLLMANELELAHLKVKMDVLEL